MRTRQPQLEYRLFNDVPGGERVRTRQPQPEYRLFDDVLGGEALTEGGNETINPNRSIDCSMTFLEERL